MEIEVGAREISNKLPVQPYLVQQLKNTMDGTYSDFNGLPDFQKWRLIDAWIQLAESVKRDVTVIAKQEWATRTKITQRVLKLKSEGVPPDAVLSYRGILWTFLNRGEFSSDPILEDKVRQHLRCWDEWAEESRKNLDLLNKAQRWFWFGMIPSIIVMLWAMLFGERRVRVKYNYLEMSSIALAMYERDKPVHPAAIEASNALMSYLRDCDGLGKGWQ